MTDTDSETTPCRYGVFLRPDPRTCATEIRVHAALKQQYGFVSCPVFPPHATLAGSVRITVDETEAVAAIDKALAGIQPFTVHNAGHVRLGEGIVYDVHHLPDGTVNTSLAKLVVTVNDAFGPISGPVSDYLVSPFDATRFTAHLSLAAFELVHRPDLFDEVFHYIDGLGEEPPRRFTADTVSMYRFHSEDWSGHWWQTMTWAHLRSWRLGIDS